VKLSWAPEHMHVVRESDMDGRESDTNGAAQPERAAQTA
jgi:hypothetical protein